MFMPKGEYSVSLTQGSRVTAEHSQREYKPESADRSLVDTKSKEHPTIKLICVIPYMTKEKNENKVFYSAMYDDVIIPQELMGVHYKSAITARNQWIVDNSDMVVGYTIRDYGGAYAALQYAEKKNKRILKLK